MKRLLVVLMWVSSAALACDKGCVEYEGTCACDIKAEGAQPVAPNNDQPPDGSVGR